MMNNGRLRQIIVILTTVIVFGLNVLANALPLNGLSTGEISDRFDIFFVPDGYVFSIWFFIYTGLIAYSIYQALPSQIDAPRLHAIMPWYVASSAANIVWLFLWHYERFSFTLIAMLALLGSLIMIYLRLQVGRVRVSVAEAWAVQIPFRIYLGWVTVATIANTTQLLFFVGWDGFGIAPEIWAAIMLGAGVIISALMSLSRADIAYALVLVWAYVGIAVKFPDVRTVSYTAWVSAAIILILLAAGYRRNANRQRPLKAT